MMLLAFSFHLVQSWEFISLTPGHSNLVVQSEDPPNAWGMLAERYLLMSSS